MIPRFACSILLALAAPAMASAPWALPLAADPCAPTGSAPAYVMGSTDIEGIHYGGVPSEPCVAVGPAHILCLGPGDVRVFDKATGQLLRSQCQNVFFGLSTGCLSGANPVYGDGGGLIDPDCYFDRVAQRFVALSFSVMGTGMMHVQSHLHLAISQTPDPMGPWRLYHIDTSTSPFSPGYTYLPDRPSLGVSLDKIAVASHMVSYEDGPEFTLFQVMDRDSAYAGLVPDPLHPEIPRTTDFAVFDTMAFNYRLGHNASPDSTLHMLTVGGLVPNVVSYRSIRGPAGACTLSDTTGLPLNFPRTFGGGKRAPQRGTAVPLLTSLDRDANPSGLWVRNGILSLAWSQPMLLCTADTLSVIRVLRLAVSTQGLQRATLSALMDTIYSDPGMWYSFPAICDDAFGRIYLGFQGSSPTLFPSCFVTGMQPGDATIEGNPTLAKAGEKPWVRADGGGHAGRWGDFSTIDLDESVSPPEAYYAGEWGKAATTSTIDSLGTWIRSFHFPGVVVGAGPGDRRAAGGNVSVRRTWPNPAGGESHMEFAVVRAARVRIEIEDVSGRRVRLLPGREFQPGVHQATWDGRNETGARVGAGIYFWKVSDGSGSSRSKLVRLN